MKTLSLTCLAFLGLVVLTHGAPALKVGSGELVTNGSFEDGPAVEVYLPLNKDATDIKGWVVTRGQIDLCQISEKKEWPAAAGKRCLDLHGSPGMGGVKQSLTTQAGQKYRLAFHMSGNPGIGAKSYTLTVRAAGKDKNFDFDMEGVTYTDLKWEKKTWEFSATGVKTELEIHTAMPATANTFGGPLVDNVSVVAIK